MKKKNGYIIAILSVMILLIGGLAFKSVYAYFSADSSVSGTITMGHLYIDDIEPSDSTSTGWDITNLQPNQSFGGSYSVEVTSDINYYTRILFKASVTPLAGKTHADGCGDYVTDDTDILNISIDGATANTYQKSTTKTSDGYTAYYKLTPTTVESETTTEKFNIDLKVYDWVGNGYCDYYMGATVSINMYVQVMQADYLEGNSVGDASTADDMHELWVAGGIETPILDVSEYSNLTFTVLSADDKNMSVKKANTSITEANIPAYVKKDGEVYTVSQIASAGFGSCARLTSVTIPDTVTSIGAGAFFNCTALTSITIPSSVTSIERQAFQNCQRLTSITISSSVTSIGSSAFYGCTGLTSVTLTNGLTSIGSSAFYKCTGLTSIDIPSSVTSIGNYAFDGCTSLTAINVDSANTTYSSIDGVLFNKDTTELKIYPAGKTDSSYTIPSNVTYIGNYAFSGCTGLTTVVIENGVTSIGNYAFDGCTSLTAINVDSANTTYSSIDGVLFNKDTTELKIYPAGKTDSSYTIPSNVTYIGNYAFSGCTGLTTVVIENGVTSIGKYAFSYCTNLATVTFENTEGWHLDSTTGTSIDVTNASTNATNLKSRGSEWYNKDLYRA